MKKLFVFAGIIFYGLAVMAQNAKVTRVLSSADGPNVFDFDLEIGWKYVIEKNEIWRENGSIDKEMHIGNVDKRTNMLQIVTRFGLYHDLELDVILPVILGMKTNINSVNGITAVDNGLGLTDKSGNPVPLFTLPVDGPKRTGFGDMSVAFKYGIFSQARDPLYPSWVIKVVYTIPTGEVMKGNNLGVGEGLHKVRLETALSHRMAFFEPYFGVWSLFRLPASNTLFKRYGETQKFVTPGARLGMYIGAEFYPWWEKGRVGQEHKYFSLDLGFAGSYTFEGREYTPLFEALASSPMNEATRFERQNPLNGQGNPDSDPAVRYLRDAPLTDVSAYGMYTFHAGFNLQPIEYMNIGFHFTFTHTGNHAITSTDLGKDLNNSGRIEYGKPNDPTKPNEYSPVYSRALSEPGHRFYVKSWNDYAFFVTLTGKY